MADYDRTVGIQMTDDFQETIQKMEQINALFEKMQRRMSVVTDRMNKMQSTLKSFGSVDSMDLSKTESKLDKMVSMYASMQKKLEAQLSKMKTPSMDSLKTFLDTAKSFNMSGIEKMQKIPSIMASMQSVDASKVGRVFSTLDTQITPFIAHLKEAQSQTNKFGRSGNNINSLNDKFDQAKRKVKEVGEESGRTHKRINQMFTVGNMIYFFNMSKQIFRGIGEIIKKAVDFTEVENYFSRAMGNMRGEAMKFQNQMSNMFGMAMPDMMKMQATFKNMLGSLGGLSEQMSYRLSETVSKMTLDFASLYNVSIEQSATKFQAALSKQVRPIRSVSGYDITQSVLSQSMQEIGINDRKIMQMNEIEKRLLVIITLYKQMYRSQAINDFSRTIEQPANQLRVLQEQLKEVGRWIGSVFYGVVGKVLPYINGFVMAIKELIRTFAFFVGYTMPDSSNQSGTILDQMDDSLGGVSDGIEDVNGGLDDTSKKLDKIKGQLGPMDKLNVINQPEDDSGSGGSGSGGGGSMSIDPKILDFLDKMNYRFDDIRMKATEIKEAILGWVDNAKKFLDINFFEPIDFSWIKYGGNIIKEMTLAKEDIAHILGGVMDVVAEKWKPFFQQASDLFFGLLDTASLVTSTITKFWRSVWDSGGKYLFESMWDLATAFLKLATSINDNFVKPLISLCKDHIAPIFGTMVGTIMKNIGRLLEVFTSIINKLAENKTAVIVLGSAFTAMFATIKIAKFVELTSMMTGTHKILKTLGALALQHSSTFRKLWQVFSDGNTKVGGLKNTLSSFNAILGNTSLGKKYASMLGGLSTSAVDTAGKTSGLASTLMSKLGVALSWLATNPLVAVAVGIGAVVAGIVIYQSCANDGANRTKELAKEISALAEKVKESKHEIEDLGKKTKDSLADASVEYSTTENYLSKLVELTGGKNGYVDNVGQAKLLAEKLNEVCADSVAVTEEGYLTWLKTPEAIQQNIDKMKELLALKVYEEQYTEALKQEKVLRQQQADAIKKQTEAQALYNEEYKKQQALNPDADYRTLNALCGDYYTNLVNANSAVATSTYNMSLNKQQMYDLDLQTMAMNGSLEQQAIAQAQLSLTMSNVVGKHGEVTASYASLGEALTGYDTKLAEHASGVKVMTDEELAQATISRDFIIQSCIEKASAHGESFTKMMDSLKNYGLEVSAEEEQQFRESYDAYTTNGVDIETLKNQQIERLKSAFKKYGIDLNNEQASQIVNEQSKLRTNNQQIQTLKSQQYQLLKNLLDSYNNDISKKDKEAYLKKLMDSNDYGTQAGSKYVERLADELGDKYGKGTSATKKAIKKITDEVDKANPKVNVTAKTSGAEEAINRVARDRSSKLYIKPELTKNGIKVGKSTIGFSMYANGGFPSLGQMFIARERGPELVGNIGGRTAVANNDQIIGGISAGVFNAVVSAFQSFGGFQMPDVYVQTQTIVDGKVIKEEMKKVDREALRKTGKPFFNQ